MDNTPNIDFLSNIFQTFAIDWVKCLSQKFAKYLSQMFAKCLNQMYAKLARLAWPQKIVFY